METFANRIRELREEKGISQTQLSQAMGLNSRTISNYERGLREPDFKTLKKLCDYFKVTAGYLIGFEEY